MVTMVPLPQLLGVTATLWLSLGTASAATGKSILFVGNSFTYANDLDYMVRQMLQENVQQGEDDVVSQRIARGGAKLREWAVDPTVQQTIEERAWNWVVLQEQSQIPGFYQTGSQAAYNDSIYAAKQLNTWIEMHDSSETILLMTWGMRETDPLNPTLYRDFLVMNHRLQHGYEDMQKAVSTVERPVRVAPAGLAFEAVFESAHLQDDGAPVVPFEDLYVSDGKHPSVHGTYLVACTLYATLTGQDPRHLTYKPDEITVEQMQFLQQMASETVTNYILANQINEAALATIMTESSSDTVTPNQMTHEKHPNGLWHQLFTAVPSFLLLVLMMVRWICVRSSNNNEKIHWDGNKYETVSVTEEGSDHTLEQSMEGDTDLELNMGLPDDLSDVALNE